MQLANDEVMQNVMDVVREFVMASIVEGAPARRRDLTYRGHLPIVKAVASQDANAAEQAIREHLEAVLEMLREHDKRHHEEMP